MNLSVCNADFVTVVVKVVDYCNFECDFCRYYQTQKEGRCGKTLQMDTFKKIIKKACEYNYKKGLKHLTVIFHGGEPLLWGLNNFTEAIQYENIIKETYSGFYFVNDIQTNGSLINDEWADFFYNNNFSIGISIDGPEDINFHKGKEISNNEVIENLRILDNHRCKYGILSVITEKHYGKAREYYDFLVKNEIHSVGLCYCFSTNKVNLVSNKTLIDFLTELFNLYFNGNFKLHIREFEFVMKLSLGVKVEGCTFDYRRSCGNYFSIDSEGNIYFCDSYDLNEISIGNIDVLDFFEIKENPLFNSIVLKARKSALSECSKCSIQGICGGGCYRHVLPNGKHAFCETFRELYPYIEDTVKKEVAK